jgi:hypothetical protein
MDPKSTPPPLGKVLRVSAEYAARSREGVRAALLDARAGSLTPPARDEHVRRFLYGFMAPLTLIRVAWQNKPIRGSMVRRLLPPLLFLALCTTVGVIDVVESLASTRHDRAALAREAEDDDDKDDDDESPGAAAREARQAELEKAREQIRSAARSEALRGSSKLDVAAAAVSAAAAQVDAAAPRKPRPPPPAPPTGPLAVLAAMTKIAESKLAKLIATLGVIEWILIWIGREHHDVIAHDLADLTGVPCEPAPDPPKLRLDFGWIKLKGWRAVRFVLFVALAAPTAWLLGKIPEVGAPLAVTVESVWVVYWASVFAIANTFLAWEAVPPPEWAPWFVRVQAPLARIPVLGGVFRFYVRILTLATKPVWPACKAFEEAPWEAAGLALSRAIVGAPVLYLLSRPVFGPAATHALLGCRPPALEPRSVVEG